MLDFL